MKSKIIVIGIIGMFLLLGLYPTSIEGNTVDIVKDDEKIIMDRQKEKVEMMSSGENDWPMFQRDAENSGFTTSASPDRGIIRWKTKLKTNILDPGFQADSGPVIANGKVYMTTKNGNIFCLDANRGKQIWHFKGEGDWYMTTPALVDGKVYFGSHSHDRSGYLYWDFQMSDHSI